MSIVRQSSEGIVFPYCYAELKLLILLTWAIASVTHGQNIGPNVAEAQSGLEFARALASPSVRTIYLMTDIYINDSDWRGLETPILVTRNMSIEGHPDLTEWPVVSLRSVTGMVRVARGVALAMQRMVLIQNRRGIGPMSPGMDLLTPCCQEGGAAYVLIQQAILVQSVCLPRALQIAMTLNLTRPEAFPGIQVIGPLLVQPANCSNSTTAPLLQRCWPRWGIFEDVATWGQDLGDDGVLRPSGYAAHTLHTQFICQLVMTEECVQTLGVAGCYLHMETIRLRALPPTVVAVAVQQPFSDTSDSSAGAGEVASQTAFSPPSAAAASSSSSGSLLLKVVLPTVLGGCLIAVAAVGMLVWRHMAINRDGSASDSGTAAAASDGACQPTSKPGSDCGQGASDESLAVPLSDESAGEGRLGHKEADGHTSRCEEGGMAGFTDVAVCCGLEPPLIVTPFTPHRSDLRLDVVCGSADLTLLPVVRGQGNFGRVVEGLFCGERVAVKLVPDCSQWTAPATTAAPGPGPGFIPSPGGGATPDPSAAAPCAHPPRVHVKSQLQSFVQEVEVLGRCNHPNVVRLKAACLRPPQLCLVMELMETSLEHVIHNPHRQLLPLDIVLNIGMQVARGLEYLHPTIVHRDLKPGNVLLNDPYGPQPVVKITDFGLSRLRTTVMITKHPEAGTPSYMAPELYDITNSTVMDKSDMYSLGVILWEMLSGRVPWYGCDALVIAYAITINRARLPLSVIPPGRCTTKLEKLILSLWDHDPIRRPAAAEVVKQLALIQDELVRREAAAELDLDLVVLHGCGLQEGVGLAGQRHEVEGGGAAAAEGQDQGVGRMGARAAAVGDLEHDWNPDIDVCRRQAIGVERAAGRWPPPQQQVQKRDFQDPAGATGPAGVAGVINTEAAVGAREV